MRDLDINNKENNSTMPSQRPTIAPTWRAPLAQMNGDPRMLSKIPSEKQLYEWCSLNACTTKNVVFGPAGFDKATDATTFSKISYKFQNDDLLLDTFRHTFKDGQASDDAFAAADGTYKLHHGKWTVVAFGTFRTRFTLDRAYRKKFLPWAFPLRAANYKLHFEPIISSDTISTHRAHFHFDCTSFMNTDWLCSPVLATMSLRNQFDSGEVE
ncbi:hypothetical protein PC115_g20116 [Phytophthora cactorum]|uniref:Uncharacterized protein n=1 Tax=Phytophthora cactorum TaxID=29920 RepID=A0A8T1BAY5_9STRA|nr:hypothetical protein PC115_g20116 [Phytophthora cactorum]KAG2899072.1 hypothetical protein PC117_g22375 [Phytophthora cactorum]